MMSNSENTTLLRAILFYCNAISDQKYKKYVCWKEWNINYIISLTILILFFFSPRLPFPFHLEMANDVRLGLRSMVRIYNKHTDDWFLVENACTDESLLVSSSSLPSPGTPLDPNLCVVGNACNSVCSVYTVEVALVASSPSSRVPLQRHWHAHQPALILYCILLLVLRNVSLHSLLVLFYF